MVTGVDDAGVRTGRRQFAGRQELVGADDVAAVHWKSESVSVLKSLFIALFVSLIPIVNCDAVADEVDALAADGDLVAGVETVRRRRLQIDVLESIG